MINRYRVDSARPVPGGQSTSLKKARVQPWSVNDDEFAFNLIAYFGLPIPPASSSVLFSLCLCAGRPIITQRRSNARLFLRQPLAPSTRRGPGLIQHYPLSSRQVFVIAPRPRFSLKMAGVPAIRLQRR